MRVTTLVHAEQINQTRLIDVAIGFHLW